MKAVLVFCEGNHDVVFVERSLGACANCVRMERPIGKLPSPFGADDTSRRGLIAQRLQGISVEDLALRDKYPPTPQFQTVLEESQQRLMFLLIQMGSKWNENRVIPLVRGVDELMHAHDEYEVSEHAVAFLFDANDVGVSATVSTFRDKYASYYGDLSGIAPGHWMTTAKTPVGLYVLHADSSESGTLENHVAPMVESAWPDRYAAATEYIDRNSGRDDAVSRSEANRLKAVITSAGQFDHPSRPMTTILAHNGLPDGVYRSSSAANDLASFLLSTPWQRAGGASEGATTGAAQEAS